MEILESVKNLTKDNGAIRDLRDLLVLTTFMDEALERFFTFRQNVQNGDKLGWTGEMEDIGKAGAGCNPTYEKVNVAAAEKTWDLGEWSAPIKWCYEDFINTVAEYCLKTGTQIGDLLSTDLMDIVVLPAMERAIQRMMWRFIWFGDKAAQDNGSGGVLTTGVEAELFKPCDGFWKQLFAVGTANAGQLVAIDANSQASTAEQMSAIKGEGVAIKIFDDLLTNADSRIASMDEAGIFATKSLTDALAMDLKKTYKEILTWEQIYNGIEVTEYNGIPVYRVSIWDRMIKQYENNGTKLNKPHRAVFTSPSQLLVGSPANNIISSTEVWFNQDTREVRSYSAGKLGCLIGEDDLVQLAY